MSATYFVWLGSGRARKVRVAPEGQLLDRVAKAGLPVAPGAILLDEFYRVCLENNLAEVVYDRVIIPEAERLHATLFRSVRLPRFGRPVAMSLVTPDTGDAAMSAESRRRHVIDADQPDELAHALATAWNAAARWGDSRRDLLLVEEVAVKHSGLACTGDRRAVDRITYHDGGDVAQTSLPLPQLTGWQRPDETLPPHDRRLQMLLRGVRRTLGRGEWTIEWVDDGRICRIMQIAPVRDPGSDEPASA